MKEASKILRRVLTRDLYQYVGIYKIVKEEIKQFTKKVLLSNLSQKYSM